MRILMYCPFFPPQYSGAATQAIALAAHLHLLGHAVEFITIRDAGLPKFEEYNSFPVHRLDINGRRNQELPLWWNFFCFAWRNHNKFDVLHSHGAHYLSSVVGPISKLVGWHSIVKATMSNDDLHGLRESAAGILHYLFLKTISAYIAISHDLVREFELKGFDSNRIHYIPNGVDTNRFRPALPTEKLELRVRFDLPPRKRILLSVGVFDKRKNIGWLIKEWDKQDGFDGKNFLLAIGPQSREDKQRLFLNSLKEIADRRRKDMRILDHVANIEQYYKAADVFVLPSTNEGLPNVILEAMASGLPCIATRSPGTKELVVEDKTGFLYDLNIEGEFVSKLRKLNNDQITLLGQNGRQEVEENYSLAKIALIYSNLYKRLKNGKTQTKQARTPTIKSKMKASG